MDPFNAWLIVAIGSTLMTFIGTWIVTRGWKE